MAGQLQMCKGYPNQKILEAAQTIHHSLNTRHKTIDILRKLASEADSIHQGCAASNRDANMTGAVGGGFTIVAGGLLIACGGLAAPFVLASLNGFGAACSIGGGAWSLMNQYDKGRRSKELQEEILEQLVKDEEARNEAKIIIGGIKRGDFGEPRNIFRGLHNSFPALGSVGWLHGFHSVLIDKGLALPSVASCISSGAFSLLKECYPLIAESAAFEGIEEVSQQSAASAVKFMHSGLSKNFVERDALKAAQNAYKNVFEEAIENAAAQAGKVGGNIAAKKTAKMVATENAKVTATIAARSAAKSAAEQSAKTAARVTGSVTLGFGVLTSVLEGYNAYQYHCETQKESQLGRELRDLANRLENDFNNEPA